MLVIAAEVETTAGVGGRGDDAGVGSESPAALTALGGDRVEGAGFVAEVHGAVGDGGGGLDFAVGLVLPY